MHATNISRTIEKLLAIVPFFPVKIEIDCKKIISSITIFARGNGLWDMFFWSSLFSRLHFRNLLRQIHHVQAGKAAFPIVSAELLSVMTVQPAHRPKIVRPIWAAVQQTASLSKAARLLWNHHREIVLADREPIALAPEVVIIAIPIAGRKATSPIDGNSWKMQ